MAGIIRIFKSGKYLPEGTGGRGKTSRKEQWTRAEVVGWGSASAAS